MKHLSIFKQKIIHNILASMHQNLKYIVADINELAVIVKTTINDRF